jgi:acetyl esterase/lipase
MAFTAKFAIVCVAILAIVGAVAACSPVAAINALTPTGTYTLHADIAYGSDPRQKLDVYVPRNAQTSGPVVAFFYGGNWNSGSRKDYEFVGEALASRGMVAVIADYRLYPQVRYPEFLKDCAAAVGWTVRETARYGGDPRRIFIMGHSAGAYNAAEIALDSRWLAAQGLFPSLFKGFIGLAGPYDFIPIENADTRPVFLYPDTPPDSQPVNHVSASAPPTLLIASNSDSLVNPVRNTGGLAKRLRAGGVPVEEVYFDRTTHTTLIGAMSRPLRALAPVLDTVDAFVRSRSRP